MKFKDSTHVGPIHPSISYALDIIDLVYLDIARTQATVTALRNGQHGGSESRSYHYGDLRGGDTRCRAIDVRTRDILRHVGPIVTELRRLLGASFDIVSKDHGTGPHIHIEYDPKKPNGDKYYD